MARITRRCQGAALIRARIARLKLGLPGDLKPLKAGVCELRVHYGAEYRVYVGMRGPTLVVLLCGGAKGSQKRDIQRAIQYWQEFKSEAGDEK